MAFGAIRAIHANTRCNVVLKLLIQGVYRVAVFFNILMPLKKLFRIKCLICIQNRNGVKNEKCKVYEYLMHVQSKYNYIGIFMQEII